jgi:hypothetical protein
VLRLLPKGRAARGGTSPGFMPGSCPVALPAAGEDPGVNVKRPATLAAQPQAPSPGATARGKICRLTGFSSLPVCSLTWL